MMNVVIAGGGTGGHVFPALAVGEALIKRGARIMFVGTKKGLESEMVPRKGWRIEYLSAPRWKGEGFLGRIKAMTVLPFAVFNAWKMLGKFEIDVVVGVGGYASAPIVMASALRRIPSLLMEQNSIPGLANRMLGRFAKRICITFPESGRFFNKVKVLFTGNPVREEIRNSIDRLPSFQGKFVVLCFGGSQGAKSINEAVFASLRHLRNKNNVIKFIHQIGSNADVEMARDIYQREGFEAEVYRFIDNIADCYSRSHLVICRAGATSVAELMVAGRPAILVPYPFAANDHQAANARSVAESGGAVVVPNNELNGEKVTELITDLMNSPDRLEKMSESMKRMAKPNAAEMIVDECFKLVPPPL